MRPPLTIGGRSVGQGHPCLVVAEAGVNHNGDMGVALALVDAAGDAGADAVKFQSFTAAGVATADAPKAEYAQATTDQNESHMDMLKRLELSEEDHRKLMDHCKERGLIFLSTPFDLPSVDLLDDLGVEAMKVPSGELNNLILLRHVARTGKPIILSTGMSYMSEVDLAVRTVLDAGCRKLVLLHCVSNYPADPANSNLRAMETLTKAFDVPVGLSDHTQGAEVPMAAVALGACMIEKHITLDRAMPGPDHSSSMEPEPFGELVSGIRTVEAALGTGVKRPVLAEDDTRKVIRRSLAVERDAAAGDVLTGDMLTALRPASGIAPEHVDLVLGRRLSRDVSAGTLLDWQDIA